ncbi:tRNA:m(4)X modification enzyme TRM13 [Phlyctochytrium bullatum]|nr:tRNA:m(4)X modification enzyme TRM13 [Phlyctochytrium bullatum]
MEAKEPQDENKNENDGIETNTVKQNGKNGKDAIKANHKDVAKLKPNQCQFLIPGKGRCCPLFYNPKHSPEPFCPNHLTTPDAVPCPFDSRHSVAKRRLEQHVRVCNKRPRAQPDYFQLDVNLSRDRPPEQSGEKVSFSILTSAEQKAFLEKLRDAVKNLPQTPSEPLVHHSMENVLAATSAKKRKHHEQQASILGHLDRNQLLERSNIFVEYGAAKAELSHRIHLAVGNPARFVLLDRRASRLKVNRSKEEKSPPGTWNRVQMDLKDFNLTAYMEESSIESDYSSVVVYSKHLCGAGADLALKSARDKPDRTDNKDTQSDDEAAHDAKETLVDLHKGTQSDHEAAHDAKETLVDLYGIFGSKEDAGQASKKLIDFGRLEFLKEKGFNAQLVQYLRHSLIVKKHDVHEN